MVKTFITEIYEHVIENYSPEFHTLQLIFPSRRACTTFSAHFKKKIGKPTLLPSVISIDEFITTHSQLVIADNWLLISELFQIYKKYYETDFDTFYPWGKILIGDFDEIDNHLADGNKLFSTLEDISSIERKFEWAHEEKESIHQFWKSLLGDDYQQSDMRKNFVANWKHLRSVYAEFCEWMLANNLAYGGFAKRNLLADVKLKGLKSPFTMHLFCGFYAFSKSEEAIVATLIKNQLANIIWDIDSYFLNHPYNPAGDYLKHNKLIDNNSIFQNENFATANKSIIATGFPSNFSQVQYASSLINRASENGQALTVVLPDESILLPLLHSIDSKKTKFNITTGLPLRNSMAEHLVLSYIQLIEKFKFDKSQKLLLSKVYFDDFISNPLLAFAHLQHENNEHIEVSGNYFFITTIAPYYQASLLELIANAAHSQNLGNNILQLIEYVLQQNDNIDFANHALLQQLVLIINRAPKSMEQVNFAVVIKDILRTVKVPFQSDKNAEIQLMGFLETRCLDFDNLVILNLNEGILPSDATLKTYIPYSLRKSFKLPLEENNESISAYHFYRLLQRTSNVELTFNTEVNSLGGGEPSRYIRQLEYDIIPHNTHITYQKRVMVAPAPELESIQLTISKTPALIEKLRNMYCTHKVKFSPTAINMYIECKLKFYYRYILNIKEPPKLEEELSASQIGNIIHLVMENAYKGKTILSDQLINELEAQLNNLLYHAYVAEYQKKGIQNHDLITYEVLRNIIKSIFEIDKERLPITLVALEQEFENAFKINDRDTVLVKGIIDRIEKGDDHFLIVDYKTGKVDLTENLENIFTNSKYKVAFQLLLYAAAFNEPAIKVAAFPLKKVKSGLEYLFDGNIITESLMIDFKQKLHNLLNEIVNDPVDFAPTTNLDSCSYCDFKLLCRR